MFASPTYIQCYPTQYKLQILDQLASGTILILSKKKAYFDPKWECTSYLAILLGQEHSSGFHISIRLHPVEVDSTGCVLCIPLQREKSRLQFTRK